MKKKTTPIIRLVSLVLVVVVAVLIVLWIRSSGVDTRDIAKATDKQIESLIAGLEGDGKIYHAYVQKIECTTCDDSPQCATCDYAFVAHLVATGIDNVEVWFLREKNGTAETIYSASSGSKTFSKWPYNPEHVPDEVLQNITEYVEEVVHKDFVERIDPRT